MVGSDGMVACYEMAGRTVEGTRRNRDRAVRLLLVGQAMFGTGGLYGRSDNRNSGIAGLKIEYPKLSIT